MDRWNIIKEAIYGVHPVPEALRALQDIEAEIGNLEAENENLLLRNDELQNEIYRLRANLERRNRVVKHLHAELDNMEAILEAKNL